jgi:guanylate kinase
MSKRTKLFIVSAPSGAGKSSLCERALKDFSNLEDIITYTTRPMRPNESQGNPYHFVSKEKFQELKKEGFFVEDAVVHTNFYGTPGDVFDKAWNQGKYLIIDTDVQGAATFRKKFPQAVFIFIRPPNIDELRKRLQKRDGVHSKDLELRLKNATYEMEQAPLFEFQIINDNFDKAYAEFKKIIEGIIQKG